MTVKRVSARGWQASHQSFALKVETFGQFWSEIWSSLLHIRASSLSVRDKQAFLAAYFCRNRRLQ